MRSQTSYLDMWIYNADLDLFQFKHKQTIKNLYKFSSTQKTTYHNALKLKTALINLFGDRRCRDPMVVGFTTTCEISVYHHCRCEFEYCSWHGILYVLLCDR
jgi:hypothetical protein